MLYSSRSVRDTNCRDLFLSAASYVRANIVAPIFLRIPRALSSGFLVVGLGTLIKKPYYRYGNGAHSVMKYFLDVPPHNERSTRLLRCKGFPDTIARNLQVEVRVTMQQQSTDKAIASCPPGIFKSEFALRVPELSFCIIVISMKMHYDCKKLRDAIISVYFQRRSC